MKHWFNRISAVILAMLALVTVGGLSAAWIYPSFPEAITVNPGATVGSFAYGQLYITETNITDGSYESAAFSKTGDTKLSAQVTLLSTASSSVTVEVVFYNATGVTYYYDTTETLSTDNPSITYTVSGIVQKEEVPSKTYKTVTVTFAYDGAPSLSALLSELNFKFTVDKDSIGELVAETAVDRFADILNNVVMADSYDTLDSAMNNRGSSWNKASAVTYIGNVAGADSSDSATIIELFGEEFMKADLDGDGVEEPITMMIKRENLDGNIETGADYTYRGTWGNSTTVQGVEMTLYITAEEIGSSDIVVYAATYTKLVGADEWTLLVPLTKGTASTNNYSGWGTADSFNTDTWRSDNNETIEQLVSATV